MLIGRELFPHLAYAMAMSETPVNHPPAALSRAIQKLLRPLVRLLLRFQVTFPVFSQLLKQVYVEVADEDIGRSGSKATDSRISLLTGVHRKDVRRLRAEVSSSQGAPEILSLGTRMIGAWLAESNYLDASGQPKPLPLKQTIKQSLKHTAKQSKNQPEEPGRDNAPSFDRLVTSVTKQDIRPKVVLDEWLRLGIVSLQDGYVVLNQSAFVPQHGFDEKAWFFGKNLHDHMAAGAHNLLGGEPPQFDRAVFYNNLRQQDIKLLETLVNEKASDLLVEVNKQAKHMQADSRGQAGAHFRFNLGACFWVEEQQSTGDGATGLPSDQVAGES